MTQRPFRFGIVAAQARSGVQWLATAQRAEALGYHTFLIPDTLGPTLAPLPALAAVAAVTQSIHIGTYVLANDFRNPVLVARECATLDFLSQGRFELGLGAGRPGVEHDYRMLGIPYESGGVRVTRLHESVQLIKKLLNGQQADAIGPSYPITGATIFPAPVQQPRLPILIAAAGDRMLELAAQEADIIALALAPDTGMNVFAEKIAFLRQAAGQRFGQLELNINLIAVGQEIPAWITQRMGIDPATLLSSGSPSVLMGSGAAICEQLLERREALGVSYITLSEMFMETLAPVVKQLAGR